jgi:DNA-binding PucR family transcriptional regulator
MSLRSLLSTVCFLSFCGAPGCGMLERAHECQAVIETVNTSLSDLQVQVPDAGESADAYTQIAGAYDALGKRLEALAPKDPTLAKAIAGYQEITQHAAERSRAYSEALLAPGGSRQERGDKRARLSRIRADAQADLTREAQAVRKLNAVCHPQ